MDIQYPIWLPQEAWKEYLEMRKRIKAPLTRYGEKLAISKLEKLKDLGHDPEEVINQSIFYSWRGLFEIKASNSEPIENPFEKYRREHGRQAS